MIDFEATLDTICALQDRRGMIPWARGLHADPWNHTEALMALALGGRHREARRGLDWLAGAANRDGSYCQFFTTSAVREPRIDLNNCLYPAVGALAYLVSSRDAGSVRDFLISFDVTVDFVLAQQRNDGSFPWALAPDRTPLDGSLLAGSSAMVLSLEAIEALDALLGRNRPRIKEASAALTTYLCDPVSHFLAKDAWAMDGYYPVLAGVLDDAEARRRMEEFLTRHYISGAGVQAIAGSSWVTAAETAETAMAMIRLGELSRARQLLEDIEALRRDDGGYLTGWVVPNRVSFPADEESAYSAAAVSIAWYLMDLGRPTGLIEGILACE
ncbi:hypothetical protein [Ferrimicrobium sp.]|uniref:hypothetical protein n=1 Tax=Ferrimicrobium sp. TaxID=2926050 RepID=UPI002626704A|nr:hypothetical protein [Ferrimicrobium sp.]